MWVDYSIPSPFAAHCFEATCTSYSAATDKCEQKKFDDAGEAASLSNAKFYPFVVAATGGFADGALEVVELMSRARASRWGLDLTQVRDLIIDQIAVCIQRGNARTWEAAYSPRSRSLAFSNRVSYSFS